MDRWKIFVVADRVSVSEAAVFAAEFAGAVGDKRRNGHRKFFMSMLELFSVCSLIIYMKQNFTR